MCDSRLRARFVDYSAFRAFHVERRFSHLQLNSNGGNPRVQKQVRKLTAAVRESSRVVRELGFIAGVRMARCAYPCIIFCLQTATRRALAHWQSANNVTGSSSGPYRTGSVETVVRAGVALHWYTAYVQGRCAMTKSHVDWVSRYGRVRC